MSGTSPRSRPTQVCPEVCMTLFTLFPRDSDWGPLRELFCPGGQRVVSPGEKLDSKVFIVENKGHCRLPSASQSFTRWTDIYENKFWRNGSWVHWSSAGWDARQWTPKRAIALWGFEWSMSLGPRSFKGPSRAIDKAKMDFPGLCHTPFASHSCHDPRGPNSGGVCSVYSWAKNTRRFLTILIKRKTRLGCKLGTSKEHDGCGADPSPAFWQLVWFLRWCENSSAWCEPSWRQDGSRSRGPAEKPGQASFPCCQSDRKSGDGVPCLHSLGTLTASPEARTWAWLSEVSCSLQDLQPPLEASFGFLLLVWPLVAVTVKLALGMGFVLLEC